MTLSSHKPEWFAQRAKKWGVAALGVNCGRDIDMSDIIEIIRRYRQETDLPLFARPNAGTPTKQDGRWVWPHSAESMAARLPELMEAGACMIGGCCGTTPEYIAAFRRDRPAQQRGSWRRRTVMAAQLRSRAAIEEESGHPTSSAVFRRAP